VVTISPNASKRPIQGNNKPNNLKGAKAKDTIYGYGGNDFLNGGDGNDAIYGGDGNDYLYGGDGNDVLQGGKGNDILEGGAGDDKLYLSASVGKDTVRINFQRGPNLGSDTVYGFQKNDCIDVRGLYGAGVMDTLEIAEAKDKGTTSTILTFYKNSPAGVYFSKVTLHGFDSSVNNTQFIDIKGETSEFVSGYITAKLGLN
jgi:Ca2+-binding RTX toxin-like protein